MKKDNLHIDQLIDNYLDGNLSIEEKLQFEKELGESTELYEQLENEKLLRELVFFDSAVETSDLLIEKGEDLKRIRNIKRVGLLVIGLAAVIGLGSILFFLEKETQEEKTEKSFSKSMDEITLGSEDVLIEPFQKEKSIVILEKPLVYSEPESKEYIEESSDSVNEPNEVIIQVPTNILKQNADVNEEKSISSPVLIACDSMRADIVTEASCYSKPTGLIEVTRIQGGSSPYEVSLNANLSDDGKFTDLFASEYSIQLKDKNDCKTNVLVIIEERLCEEKIYVFNPEIEEYWEFPNDENLKGEFILLNKFGGILVEKRVEDIDGKWNGVTDVGERVSRGVYVFILKFEDNTVLKGELNVMW